MKMERRKSVILQIMLILAAAIVFQLPPRATALIYYHDFIVESTPCTRLCEAKIILTVNGQFPGPTLHAHKWDTLVLHVHNHADHNITLHWHGVRQQGNPWSDGAAYITQCPIRPGQNYTYTVTFTREEGTLWWHAHSHAARATVHGAIIVYPSHGTTYPFPKPHEEVTIILGEWWKMDVIDVYREARRSGDHPMHSDAYTINGHPGYLYPCSKQETFKMSVQHGKTYLLRLVSAAMDEQLFFAVAGHRLTLVGIDASYTKPFDTGYVMISPGQTMDVLVHADQLPARYAMAAGPFDNGMGSMGHMGPMGPKPTNNATTALFQYIGSHNHCRRHSHHQSSPIIPWYNDSHSSNNFTIRIRSLRVGRLRHVDEHMFVTLSMNLVDCGDRSEPCRGPMGMMNLASMNNVSFVEPQIDVLKAYYHRIAGVYEEDFPNEPPIEFDYTGVMSMDGRLFAPELGTKVKVLDFGKNVEIVFQGTNVVSKESHPMHLHGHSFYVVGWGYGNFDPKKDPLRYNLLDPPEQSTVAVPKAGWAAIRFRADNPGVWLLHCHFEHHHGVGMSMVFIVKNGRSRFYSQLRHPPGHLPTC